MEKRTQREREKSKSATPSKCPNAAPKQKTVKTNLMPLKLKIYSKQTIFFFYLFFQPVKNANPNNKLLIIIIIQSENRNTKKVN